MDEILSADTHLIDVEILVLVIYMNKIFFNLHSYKT